MHAGGVRRTRHPQVLVDGGGGDDVPVDGGDLPVTVRQGDPHHHPSDERQHQSHYFHNRIHDPTSAQQSSKREESLRQPSRVKTGRPTARLGFSGSLRHGQADEARQAGHAQTDAPDDRHAHQAVCVNDDGSELSVSFHHGPLDGRPLSAHRQPISVSLDWSMENGCSTPVGLLPVIIAPSVVNMAAPTGNRLYGQ
ncbi:hypothetical protein EYF80_017734 [Liparis tanakae]|uniref:Uncharacterized protein n=1 Tax=Liparis tanakae TaxID=230148 RepID=A0A4Z2I1K7_9TELE|nr:hypothetical protein EYF80_017734 [Liparis tanakae]